MQTAQLFLPIAAAVLSVFAMCVAWLLGGRKASWVVAGCLVLGALARYVTADRKDDAVFGIMAVLSFGSVVLVPAIVVGVLSGHLLHARRFVPGVLLGLVAPGLCAWAYFTSWDPKDTEHYATRYVISEPRLIALMDGKPLQANHMSDRFASQGDLVAMEYSINQAGVVGGPMLFVSLEVSGRADRARFRITCVSDISPFGRDRSGPACPGSRLAIPRPPVQ